jgi:hypothetical protein
MRRRRRRSDDASIESQEGRRQRVTPPRSKGKGRRSRGTNDERSWLTLNERDESGRLVGSRDNKVKVPGAL